MKLPGLSSRPIAPPDSGKQSTIPSAATTQFTDRPDGTTFQYHHEIPRKMVRGVNVSALQLYALYRNAVYESYKDLPDLAEDIKVFPKQFSETKRSGIVQEDRADPLYHYAVAASLDAVNEWGAKSGNMRAYVACEKEKNADTGATRDRKIGFINFVETEMNGKPVVYIAQAGARNFDQGVGRRLTESVVAGYPAGTEFYVLTRVFNARTKNLVRKFEQKNLAITEIDRDEIMKLNYHPDRYCGFKYVLSQEMIDDVKSRQCQQPQQPPKTLLAGAASV